MTGDEPQFVAERPRHRRRAKPWHHLAYIIEELPRRLEALVVELPRDPGVRVLDYGCADLPYRDFFPADADYVAADLPGNPLATATIGPTGIVPLADASVDAVLSTQVLEHVGHPGIYLAECARVLRPGGRLLLSTHGLMAYHPDPDDYWRWTCAGLRRAIREVGLEVVRFEGIMGMGATGLHLAQEAWYGRLPRPLRPVLALLMQSAMRLVDRLERPELRDLNAMVFAVVAEKPRAAAGALRP